MSRNTNNLSDTRFNSLAEILDWHFWSLDKSKEENRQHIDEAIAAVLALLPKGPEPPINNEYDAGQADMAYQTRRNLIGEQL